MIMMPRVRRLATPLCAGLLATALLAGCSLDKKESPGLIGPSEFALSVTAVASPDQLPRDGSSQSVVTVTVRDTQGRPVSGARLSVALVGTTSSAATLSATTITTTADGTASFAVTAPASTVSGDRITIDLIPTGSNTIARTLTIALTPSNPGAPVADFENTPSSPVVNESVLFDASGTKDEGVACGTACTYSWSFGDGGTGTGITVTHTFTSPGSKIVVLTVRDPVGATATKNKTITLSSPEAPTIDTDLTVTPSSPVVNQVATLTVEATPASGRRIVVYEWDFADGDQTSTTVPTVTHKWRSAGKYGPSVRVIDDLGTNAASSTEVTVTAVATGTGPTAVITVSPTGTKTVGQEIFFDGGGSSAAAGSTIVEYTWVWGDGSQNTVTSSPQTQYSYSAAGTYVVRLTVKDSLGRTGSTTTSVTVQ